MLRFGIQHCEFEGAIDLDIRWNVFFDFGTKKNMFLRTCCSKDFAFGKGGSYPDDLLTSFDYFMILPLRQGRKWQKGCLT